MVSGISTKFLPEKSYVLCETLKLSLQEKQASNNSNMINEEVVARADELLEYKRMSTKQHKLLLLKCLNEMSFMK